MKKKDKTALLFGAGIGFILSIGLSFFLMEKKLNHFAEMHLFVAIKTNQSIYQAAQKQKFDDINTLLKHQICTPINLNKQKDIWFFNQPNPVIAPDGWEVFCEKNQ